MVIKDLLPGKAELVVIAILLSVIFCYEIIRTVKKLVGFLKR